MCGRFAFYSSAQATAELFATITDAELEPRYNIAPTQDVAAIRSGADGERELVMLRWGLVPGWAKDRSIGNRMINARAETVAEKPSFREAFRRRRCLVLADGFYEWRRVGDAKVPYFISPAGGEPFAFAGLWERWTDRESGERLETTTLITRAANAFMEVLHHRMPVVLRPETADQWLNGENDPIGAPSPPMRAWPVARTVNNARNEGVELIASAGDVMTEEGSG